MLFKYIKLAFVHVLWWDELRMTPALLSWNNCPGHCQDGWWVARRIQKWLWLNSRLPLYFSLTQQSLHKTYLDETYNTLFGLKASIFFVRPIHRQLGVKLKLTAWLDAAGDSRKNLLQLYEGTDPLRQTGSEQGLKQNRAPKDQKLHE